jgi:putative phosphoserine phosphatase/1-acylglycerol-3-phosphate O-acyltransferase
MRGEQEPTVTLAAFDFDGTVIDRDAGVHFAQHLLARGYLDAFTGSPAKTLARVTRLNLRAVQLVFKQASLHARYKFGNIDRRGMVERAYEGFRGAPADEILEHMEPFARERLVDHLRDPVVDQMRHHERKGHHVVVISTGLQRLIWPLRDAIDVDFEVVACRLRRDDGHLTGRVEGPLEGSDKCTRLLAIAKRRGHELDEAFAYSDHENDAVMLDMVGNSVAVEPTKRLRRIARREGWPVMET